MPKPEASSSRPSALVKWPLPSASMRTLPPQLWSLPHAPITNASFTDTHTISCTPFDFRSPAFSTKPGRCFIEHVGVNAPGTAKITTFLPFVSSPVDTSFGPPSPISFSLTSGSLSPALMAIRKPPLGEKALFDRARSGGQCSADRHGERPPTSQPHPLRRARSGAGALVSEGDRPHRRRHRTADHRHREHVDRDDAVQLHAADARRAREAGCVGGGR